ncbi:MAG: hypothetical protein FJY67_01440 [Calditrichaeota bacterium]|nr:hypothetical protein [Calditrichota bacterium]
MDSSDFLSHLTELIVPLAFFAVAVLIVYFVIKARLRLRDLEHAERMHAIEHGVPLPESPTRPKARNPYKWPAIFIAIGLAILIASTFGDGEHWGFGLGMVLVGVALLYAHKLNQQRREAMPAPPVPPPPPPILPPH